ncbi:MAG: sigma-70 family RNA polymerase sigma factor [bacterium]
MNESLEPKFPIEFGESIDDFLKKYAPLIYKIIYERTKEYSIFETEDLFNDFFIYIVDDNYRRLRCFRGESQPVTYLGKILRNFLCDQYRKKENKIQLNSLDGITEGIKETMPAYVTFPQDTLTGELINDAFKTTFSKLSNREKLIFDLFVDKEMTAIDIASLLKIKIKLVYKNNEKIKKNLKKELKKKGVREM